MQIVANGLMLAIVLILILFRRNEIMGSINRFIQSTDAQIAKALLLLIVGQGAIDAIRMSVFPESIYVQAIVAWIMITVAVVVLGRLLVKNKGYISFGDMMYYSLVMAFSVAFIHLLLLNLFKANIDWSGVYLWVLAGYVFMVLGTIQSHALAHFFVRHGYSKWYAIIPFYNLYILCQITDKQFITELLLAIIPIVNIYYAYLIFSKVCQIQKFDDKHAIFATIFPFVAISKIFYDNKENYARTYKFGYGK